MKEHDHNRFHWQIQSNDIPAGACGLEIKLIVLFLASSLACDANGSRKSIVPIYADGRFQIQ